MRAIALAGMAGGAAEVLWIAVASSIVGVEAWQVSRGVTSTVFPNFTGSLSAPLIGLAIHFALSIALTLAFASTIGKYVRGTGLLFTALVALGLVWVFNFQVVLPWLNPTFTELLPHPVTLISKLLFGVAMAAVLSRSQKADCC